MNSRMPKLSKATASDLPAILTLLRACKLLESGVAEAIDEFFVVRADTTLLGCAGLEAYGQLGLLRSVAVEAHARKSGLGRELVEAVVASARAHGFRELFLLTTIAAASFEHLGFVIVPRAAVPPAIAESWEFRVGCAQTAQLMRLALVESP
ncbi:MAG: arsenic resistance N-acetyltransferase ArsN2 [Polyangiaceae bacterium]